MSKYSSSVNNLLHIRQSGNDKYVAIGKDRNSSITNLDDVNIQAQFRVLDNIWTPSINLNNIESTYNSNVINIGSGNTIIQLNPHIGIGTNDPSVSFEINTVDSMKIPKGNTSQRPTNLTSTDKGFIRYNAELDQFEGFGAGDQWRSLEGVIDTDQDTYITAHNNAFDDNDELQFYTAGDQRMIIKSDGKVGIGTSTPNVSLDISYKTDAIKLPKGDTTARNAIGASGIEDQGLIRYNTELNQFEGYGAGNAWGSLGGVIDIDQDTFIRAESNTTDNDELQFYTDGDQRMIIKDDGKIGIGTSTPSVLLDIYDCNEHILKVGYDNIEISRSIIPSNSNVDIGDPENQIRDMYVSDNSLWIGDTHKISHSDGKLKFRKRKTTNIPQVILDLPAYSGSTQSQILQAISTFFNDDNLLTVSNITLKHWLGFYREQKGADRTISIQEIFRDDADDYEQETAADAWLVTRTDDIYLGNDYSKVGIGTDNPNVSLDVSYRTDAIKLPKGDTTARNAIGASSLEDQGLIRYNTELQQFEGFGAGNAWGSLGGVIDIDQDTYIKAETNATDNDELQFYTDGDERMIIKSDGKIGLNVSDPSHQVHIKGNTRIEGDLIVNGTQRIIDTDTSTTEQFVITNDGTGPALIVNQIGAHPIMDVQDDSNSVFFIENGGNVGVGTITPNEKLHINGNINIVGNIICDSLDTRFAELQDVLTITAGSITNDKLATLVQPDLVSAKAINIDSTSTGGLDNSTDDLKIKAQGVNNNHILNGTIDLTQKVVNNLPVANGGTGANTANNARTNLGLAIGTNVQAYSAKLQSIANLAASAAKIPMFSGLTSTSLLDFVDDEEMLGNSATAVPSQRSVKKYVDTLVGFLNIVIYTLHASNLDSNVEPLAPEAEATLTLDADYSIVGAEGTEQYDTFIVDMTTDLADTLGVDESIIEITEVSEGSLVVDFVLKPSEIDSNFNPSQAVVALKENLENPDIAPNSNSKFLKQATVEVPPEVVAQALDPSKIFVTLENDRAKIINIAKYFKGEFITYELITNPHDNVLIDSALQQITITGAFRDSIYDIVINANKGPVSKDLIFNITEPAPFPPTAKDPKKLVLSDNKKQVNLLDKFKGSYLEIFEIDQNPFNNVSLVDSSNMIYEVQGAFRDTSYSIVFKATQNGGDNLSAYWTLNIKELPLIPTKLLPDIDNLLIATGQTITYNLKFVFIGNGLEYGFRTNPYPDNIYISNNVLYITENQRGITYPIEVFGKNLAQTLIWKITLTEDLPPAPTVIGVDSSNFITTDIINYDLTTIFSGINVSYDIEYYYNIGGSIYPPIDSFFIQNKPWARYHSKNWNKYLNRIVDTSGYNRESIELLSGNISIGSNYISGDKDASMKIPMPNTLNWTVCFAVKYNGANKGTIISGEQTILGHWNGYRGFVQLGGQLLTKIESIGNADDWLILCIKTNGTAPNNIRLNGTSIGVQTNEVALDYLYINKDLNSDWIFGDFMVWDYEFNTSQTLSVSDLFLDHIAGTTNALNNDIQPVELKSIYNNYNFESNIVSISGNNRGTKYDIYVLGLNTRNSVKWKLEIGEGAGTRSENISLTKGVHEYNIKHLFNSTDYKPHLTVNNENFYNINGNVLTFYPNYRDLEYGLIINSANEQYIFNIKEETGIAPRSFSDNNFHLIDNRVIENVDVIGANATVDNTIVIESTTVLYFPESIVSSLLLIDNNKYYYINNIVLNGIYQIKCDANDIKVLDNTLNVKYSSLSNGIAVDNTVVNNLLTDVFSVADASSNPKFVLKYTPYEKVTILNNFVNLVSTVDVNPEFSSGSGSIISGSTYSYSSDNNFTANFTEQFDNCELLLIDNNKYYYNSNVSLDGNKQFTLSSSNVELVGSAFNSGTDGEVIDLTNVNALITNVFGSDQIISGGSSDVSIPLTQEPVVNPVIDLTNVVAWYKFNDSTNIGLDSSGNSYNITVTNEVASSFTELGFDNNPTVMQFDTGTYAEYVSSSSANNLVKHQNNKPYCSISFWAKNLSATTTHQVLWISKINGTDFKMYISPNSNKLQLIYYTGNWSNSKYTESAEIPTLFSANWKHFVIISNGSNGIIKIRDETENSYTQYLNLDISGLGNMGVGNETFTLSFGVDDVASGSVIDDFRIYDKVLSDTEINGIYGEKSLVVLTSQTDYKVLTFNGNNTKIFSFREDESPYSWQEAYDEAIANGNRMPTKTELLDYLASQGNQPLYQEDAWCAVVAPEYSNGRDYIQIGNHQNHFVGKSNTENGGYPSWGDETNTYQFKRFYCEVIEKTEYTLNFPMDTKCDILLVGDNKYALESGVILNGDYTFKLGSTSKIIKNSSDIYTSGTTDLNTVTELLPISTFGSWNTHNQTAINAGGRLPTRAEIIALLNGDTTNNHLINPNVDPNTNDIWIPVSDYVGAIIEIGDYPHTPPFYKMSTPNGGETYSEGTTTAYGDTVDTVLNLDVQWAPKTNIYYTKVAISSDISGTATDYDSSVIVLKYYMVSSGGSTGTIDTTNMLVWYKFDDDLIDSSGNGNSLIASSVSAPTLTESGITGNALRFQNNIDTTTITNGLRDGTCKIPSINLVDKEFSISFWIKLVNNFDTNHSGIFMLGYNEGLQTDGYIKLSCAYYESKNNIDFYYKNNLSDEGGNASTDLSIDTWYNIIITITNSHLKVYTNNILTSTESLAEGLPDVIYDTNYLGFYADSTYTNTKDDFIIDDFRIYDKALTAQEISDIYNKTEPLVGGSSSSTTGTIDTTNLKLWFLFNDDLVEKITNTTYTLTQGTPNYIAGKFDKGLNIIDDTKLNILNHTDIIVEGQTTVSFSFWLNNLDQNVRDQTLLRYRPTNILLRYSSQYETIGTFVIILEGGSMTKVIGNITSWSHFGFIFNGDTWNIYINGIDDTSNWTNNSSTTTLDDGFTNDNNTFGLFYNDAAGGMDYFRSSIDDFRIYDKALTAQEISDIYNDTEPLVGGSSSSTTPGTIDTTNMLVWYKFDDAANIGLDSSGNNNDVTDLNNTVVYSNNTISVNQSKLLVNNLKLLNISGIDFSVSYKLKTSETADWFVILETYNFTPYCGFRIFYSTVLGQIVYYTYKNEDGSLSSNYTYSTGIDLRNNEWHNIVFNFKFNSVTNNLYNYNLDLYCNGTLIGTSVLEYFVKANQSVDIHIGSNKNTDASSFSLKSGSIDDFRIYNKALTAQEISDIYNDTEPLVGGSSSSTTVSSVNTVNTAKNNLVIWYNFENNLDDSSGNNHNATNPGNGISFNTDSKVNNYSLQQSGYNNADKNYVQIPNTFDLYNSWNGNGISISMWFKIDPVTDASKSWGNTLIQFSEFETDVWPMNRIMLAQNGIENKFWLGIHDPLLGDAVKYNTKNVLDGKIDSQWHHIVLSISSTGVWTLNCDTIDQGEIFTNLIPDVRYVKNTIGTSLFGTDRGTTGLVDDFRIYNKVLTNEEITAIYNNDVTQSVISTTNYTPIQRVFLKYTTIVKTIEPSIVDIVYLHPVNTTPILIANDEYYVEIKSTNIIYLPKTYDNAEILIIGSTKYVKYENVSLNEFATITINNDQTTISVNNNSYDLANGTTIDTALTTELNTYNITEHNNITKVLIKYTTSATTKITNIVFKDQEYLNVLDYATSLQITNNNITYDENNLKISSNVVKDFDNYFTETIQATNEYGTSSLDYNFIKLGYDGVVVPNLENVSKNIYISNTIANIDLREIANGESYKLIFNPYEFQNNTILIGDTLTLTTNERGIYDILISIDNKLYVLRIHETEPNIDDDLYTIG